MLCDFGDRGLCTVTVGRAYRATRHDYFLPRKIRNFTKKDLVGCQALCVVSHFSKMLSPGWSGHAGFFIWLVLYFVLNRLSEV